VEINDIIRVAIRTTQSEQAGMMVLHYRCIAKGGTGRELSDIANTFDNHLFEEVKAVLPTAATYDGITVSRIRGAGEHPAPVFASGNNGNGDQAGHVLPRQTSGLIQWRTLLSGRKNRGRTYVPFPTEAHNDTGFGPNAAYTTLLQALATDLYGPVVSDAGGNSNTFALTIWHRSSQTDTLVSAVATSNKWATQRRRSSFGRANP